MRYIEPVIDGNDIEGDLPSRSDVSKLEVLLSETPITENLRVSLTRAVVGKTEVRNYESVAVARMTIAGDVVLILADGYALNMTELLDAIRELIERENHA